VAQEKLGHIVFTRKKREREREKEERRKEKKSALK
jgi:hypothetical protein